MATRGHLEPLLRELFIKSGAEKYGISEQQFSVTLADIARKYHPHATESDLRSFYPSLHVEQLALARACAEGNERAWQDFMLRYRDKLHETALRITKDDAKARELVGSLYADLYGTSSRQEKRISKLSYYSGRGSLEGWLRTVMVQAHVNEYRTTRNLVSLDQETEAGRQFTSKQAQPAPAADLRLSAAVDETLAALSPEDRCMLAYYFLDELTLARTAALLKVHESTISRRLEKIVKSLRKDIIIRLTRKGFSRRQAEEALETDVRDVSLDIRQRLTQDSSPSSFSNRKIMRAEEGQE